LFLNGVASFNRLSSAEGYWHPVTVASRGVPAC
jgi:hypothetical protein